MRGRTCVRSEKRVGHKKCRMSRLKSFLTYFLNSVEERNRLNMRCTCPSPQPAQLDPLTHTGPPLRQSPALAGAGAGAEPVQASPTPLLRPLSPVLQSYSTRPRAARLCRVSELHNQHGTNSSPHASHSPPTPPYTHTPSQTPHTTLPTPLRHPQPLSCSSPSRRSPPRRRATRSWTRSSPSR